MDKLATNVPSLIISTKSLEDLRIDEILIRVKYKSKIAGLAIVLSSLASFHWS